MVTVGILILWIGGEIALACFQPWSWPNVGLAMTCLAGVALALVDYTSRSFASEEKWFRSLLAGWVLVPFAFGLGGSAWQHYLKWQDALDDIHEVATDVYVAVNPPEHRAVSIEDVDEAVAKLAVRRFPKGNGEPTGEATRFVELARVIGHDLRRHAWSPLAVRAAAERDTVSSFTLALAVQGLFVMWIPTLLAVAIYRSRKRLGANRTPLSRLRKALAGRDEQILGADAAYFLPRLCFGAMLVLGTNYVFAPFGLKTTYAMSLVDEHALPGHASWTLWSTSFSEVPVLVVGFVGFLLYALVSVSQRFFQDDLDDRAVFGLLVRGLIVILLSFALSGSPINDTCARLFVFVAGVFPIRGLEAIAKKANIALDPDFDTDAPTSFAGLPGLDPSKVFALRSVGIQSTYDLAVMDMEDIARRVRFDPRLLVRTVDRAILIDTVGLTLAGKLEPFGITSASELEALHDKLPQSLVDALGVAPGLAAHRLTGDHRVKNVRSWMAGLDEISMRSRRRSAINKSFVDALAATEAASVERVAKATLVIVDVSSFGMSRPLELVYAAYQDFGELVADVLAAVPIENHDSYEYGRQWVLRTTAGKAETDLGDARVIDTRPLSELGIQAGARLYAERITPAA